MNYNSATIEIIGYRAEHWDLVKNNIASIEFPKIKPGIGNNFSNTFLEVTFEETNDNSIFKYFSDWLKNVTPREHKDTIDKSVPTKTNNNFIIVEDAVNQAVIKFYDENNNELFLHSFNTLYPIQMETNSITMPSGSISRKITFYAILEQ
jgi:hypothetical protein